MRPVLTFRSPAIVLLFATAFYPSLHVEAQPFSHAVRAATIDDPSLTAPVGMIWVQSTGFGKKVMDAQLDAETAAMETVVFQGIAGTQFSMPLVTDEAESRKAHADFYDGFFAKQGFRAFVTKTQTTQPLTKFKGGKQMGTRILIDMNALRKHFEDKGVLRKFGM